MEPKIRRQTKQRSTIRQVLNEAGAPLIGNEVLHRVQKVLPSVNAATLYRNLHILEEENVLHSVSVAGKTFFDASDEDRHYFYCRECERLIGIDPDAVNIPTQEAIATGRGYIAEYVHFIVEGVCPACSEEDAGFEACATCPSLCSNVISREAEGLIACKQETV